MHKIHLFSLAFLFAAFPSIQAKVFEGQYDMAFQGKGDKVEVSFFAKGGDLRMEVQGKKGEAGQMIFRDGMQSMLMIMPQQRMYMEMPIPQDMKLSEPPKEGEDKEFPFKKTGQTRDILGYKAHEFIMEQDNGETATIWATEELGTMPFANNPMLKGWTEAMRRFTGLENFFPLETIGTEKGKETYRMTVTKVEEKSLPDDLFQPPAGFKKMTIPAGMGGMFGGG